MNTKTEQTLKFNDKQMEIISSRRENLLVSASAGSGKTTVMIERIYSLIADDRVAIDNILVCTFTKSASSDMKFKLMERLLKDNPPKVDITKLQTAQISTIHSWCQKLIKKYFHVLGIDPSFTLLDENESEVMLLESIDETIRVFAQNNSEDFVVLYNVLCSAKSNDAMVKIVKKIFNFSQIQPSPSKYLEEGVMVGLKNVASADAIYRHERNLVVDSYKDDIVRLKAECNQIGSQKLVEKLDVLWDYLVGVTNEFPRFTDVRKEDKVCKERVKLLSEKIKKAVSSIDEYLSLENSNSERYVCVLVEMVQMVATLFREKKEKKCVLDYNDLEHLVFELLNNEYVANEINETYKYVFVDEYQDVNPLQESILSALKKAQYFLVGDVKQSIYAFRLCSPDIFLDKLSNYSKYGFVEPKLLNENFRSKTKILDFTNYVMSYLMTKKFGNVDYENTARLVSGNDDRGGEVSINLVVENIEKEKEYQPIYSVKDAINDENSDTRAEAEANLIVKNIVEKLSGKNADNSPIKKSDIAILYSTRDNVVRNVYRKLRTLGIEVAICDKDKFSSVYEVNILCQLMKYLCDYTNDIALLSLLRSSLVGLSDVELARIKKLAHKKEKYYVSVNEYVNRKKDDTSKKIERFFAIRNKYFEYSKTHTAFETISAFVAETKWFMHVFATKDGDVTADALNAFLEHLSHSPHATSVYEYVRYLSNENSDYVPPPFGDAVQMMTVHASKGLQFEYVYLISTNHEFNFTDERESVLCDDSLGICLKNFDFAEHKLKKNKLTFTASLKQRRKILEERMRLLYVALTRAKQGLNIYASIKSNDRLLLNNVDEFWNSESCKSFFDWIRPALSVWGYNRVPLEDCKLDMSAVTSVDESKVQADVVEQVRKYLDVIESYKHDNTKVKSSVTAIIKDEASEQTELPNYIFGAQEDDRALSKGNAYHKFMELIDFDKDFESEFSRVKEIVLDGELVDKAQIRQAVEVMRAFCKGKKVYKEKQFMLCENGKLIQGIIDILVVDGNDCAVIDYKTSKPQTINSGAYDMQLSVYAHAVEKLTNLNVTTLAVYGFTEGKLYYSTKLDKSELDNLVH